MRKIFKKEFFRTKVLCVAVILGVALGSNLVFADPIVELAAPRITPRVIQDDGTTLKPSVSESVKACQKPKVDKKSSKKIKKHAHKKPTIVKINYDKVSKLIEYGYYDNADRILEGAISRNSKDIKAQSLLLVSMAKQCKLDPAQKELNQLLKKYPENSNLHYAQGVVYYQRTKSSNMYYRNNSQKLTADALKEFKKAIELDKTNARAYNAAGVISLNSDKPKDARDYFNKAILADKTYSLAIDNLGTMDFLAGKLNDAEKRFKESLIYNSQNSTSMYHLAQIAFQKQDYVKALNYLNNALYLNPASPAIYNLMGKAYAAQGNQAAAINSFKQSLEIKPEFTLSYLDLADIYEQRGDSEFAIEQLKTALSIEPNFNDARLKIADISLSNGNYAQAVSVYSELVGVEGYNSAALKGLASSYYAQAQVASSKSQIGSNKDLFMAFDCISKAISANPQDLELHLAKLKLAKLTNQPEQTKIELNKIIQSPSNDLMSLVVKGEAYIAMNDYSNAKKAFDSAAKLSNNIQDDLYLSEIFTYHRQFESAERVIQKILKSDPKNQQALIDFDYIQKCKKYADNYFNSAKYYVRTNNSSMAMEYLNRTISIDPNNAQARLLLAKLYEKQKDYPSAIANYKAYLSLASHSSDLEKITRKIKSLENRL